MWIIVDRNKKAYQSVSQKLFCNVRSTSASLGRTAPAVRLYLNEFDANEDLRYLIETNIGFDYDLPFSVKKISGEITVTEMVETNQKVTF